MKQLELSSDGYRLLLTHFKQWLALLGYTKITIYKLPLLIREFLFYLESQSIYTIEEVTINTINTYYKYLQLRTNSKTKGGGLSSKTLNHHQWALNKFKEYLFKHDNITLPVHLKTEKVPDEELEYLTIEEVKLLFLATESISQNEAIKQRYKALLVLLYSCGLRRNEAHQLNVEDVLFDRRLIVVQHGKNGKQRYVPINAFNLSLLQDYMYDARIIFNKKRSNALLLGYHGTRLSTGTIGKHIKELSIVTNDANLIAKKVTAHKLRHSIATHLLEQGMQIEDISLFLGHSSLESTQIYTHITEDDEL